MKRNQWLKELLKFQNETKHHYPQRYAPSKGYLDWDHQPSPFRSFIGQDASEKYFLYLTREMMNMEEAASTNNNTNSNTTNIHHHHDHRFNDFNQIYLEQLNSSDTKIHELNEKSISQLMFYSSSLSATKKYGQNKWSLRVNPSSGNLHPCEVYLVLNSKIDKKDVDHHSLNQHDTFIYSYQPEDHSLQLRCEFPQYNFLFNDQRYFFVCINTINYRETWKYGIRSYRYSQLDTGHLINCMKMSSNLLGWDCFMLNEHPSISNNLMEYLLGLDQFKELDPSQYGKEFEKFETILVIDTKPQISLKSNELMINDAIQFKKLEGNVEDLSKINRKRYGTPNLLTEDHQDWPQMEPIPILCEQESSSNSEMKPLESSFKFNPIQYIERPTSKLVAHEIIRTRRSAQSFDGKTPIENVNNFYAILEKLLPSRYPSLWRCLSPFDNQFKSMGTNVNLIIFVHRVNDLESGMYFLYRGNSEQELNVLKENSNPDFEWKQVEANLPFYRLMEGDLRKFSKLSSCIQDIASDSCFSLSMVTGKFLNIEHSHSFKQLYQEAGFIGQILYLESERIGLRGTGIGCFFDDSILGNLLEKDLPSNPSDIENELSNYQDLYHFTIGKPTEDKRIQNIPPYSSSRLNR